MKLKSIFLFIMITLPACTHSSPTSNSSFTATLPHVVSGKAIFPSQIDPHPPIVGKSDAPDPLPLTSDNTMDESADYLTIMAQNGAIITPWALAQRNWLWIYPIATTQHFGNIRNWKLEQTQHSEHFRFVNQKLKSCMESYGNGVVHNRCNSNRIGQEFELLPTDTGAVYIKNVSQQRCLTYNPRSTTGYFTLTLSTCRLENNPQNRQDQTFYLSPPLLPAVTQN